MYLRPIISDIHNLGPKYHSIPKHCHIKSQTLPIPEREEGEGGPKEKDETLEELSRVQESRDLFDTSESDEMTARADNCSCNKIVCICGQESQSLLKDF